MGLLTAFSKTFAEREARRMLNDLVDAGFIIVRISDLQHCLDVLDLDAPVRARFLAAVMGYPTGEEPE